jgi:hypothetical protein
MLREICQPNRWPWPDSCDQQQADGNEKQDGHNLDKRKPVFKFSEITNL